MTSLADAVDWPLVTDRLVLRPETSRDLTATWEVRRLEPVSRWLTRAPRHLDDYREQFTRPESLEKSLVIEKDGEVIGDLMIDVGDAWAQAEVAHLAGGVEADLGWAIHPDHGGQGLATEAVRAALGVCFEKLKLRRVTADCFVANERSWRLMERVGMRREAHSVRDSLHRSGEWLDGYRYALLFDEWRRANPE